jgi:hypothetical protein
MGSCCCLHDRLGRGGGDEVRSRGVSGLDSQKSPFIPLWSEGWMDVREFLSIGFVTQEAGEGASS